MIKNLLLLTPITFLIVFGIACGGSNSANEPTPPSNSNAVTNIDANNLPVGISASPIPPSADSTPGIPHPANANITPTRGGSPTPGIPDPETLRKPRKPGATPTPGIPSPDELRRQLQRGANGAPPPTKGDPAPTKDRKPTSKPE